MPSLLRPQNLFVLATYLVLSAIPFIPLMLGQTVANWKQILGMEFIAWTGIWAIFKRPAWFHFLLAPEFFALPIELYLHVYYGQGISTHHLGIIVETSHKEAIEFLGSKVWLLLGIVLATIAWCGLRWRAAWRTRSLDWADPSRWIVLGLLDVGGCVWLNGNCFVVVFVLTVVFSLVFVC